MPYKSREDKAKHNHKYFRAWYERNGQKRNRNKDYVLSIINWQRNNPERCKAARVLRAAVRAGEIIKPEFCQNCGRKTRLGGHHEDYLKPLEAIWLCSSCHKTLHLSNLS